VEGETLQRILNELKGLTQGQAELKQGQDALAGEVVSLKQGQDALAGEIVSLKQGQAELKRDYRALNQNVAVLERTVNDHMAAIREGLEGFTDRGRQIDRLERKCDAHDDRIWALEQAVKKS
jgi:predicted  nucleic acid-binding Zn-ribbon protein